MNTKNQYSHTHALTHKTINRTTPHSRLNVDVPNMNTVYGNRYSPGMVAHDNIK